MRPTVERRLRAEVSLLAAIVESQEEWAGMRLVTDGSFEEQVMDSEEGGVDERRNQFEGALEAALAAGLLPEAQARWLRELAERFGDPPPALDIPPEKRAELDRLLERLAQETVAARGAREIGHAEIRFEHALAAAGSLGALDQEQRREWQRRIGVLLGGESEADDDEDRSEPLLGFKAVLAGPKERNGREVTSVECYDGGLVVRCRVRYELPGRLRDASRDEIYRRYRAPDDDVDPRVTDDTGAQYFVGDGGGSSEVEEGFWISLWDWTVTPGVTATARTLTVQLEDERFDFDVAGVSERPSV
jgi:hypothetical protein